MPYDIIYCDPPWQYSSSDNLAEVSLLNNNENFHYPTMPLSAIKAIDVPSLCAENCMMYMWVVNPMLDDGIELLKHWGFKYATVGFCWHKGKVNPGYYTMSSIELVLIGKKGKIPEPRGARNVRQFVAQSRGKHSEKPQEIRDRIVEMFPTQSKLEMFARCTTPGWDTWGNEFAGDATLEVQQRETFEGKSDFME